MMTLDSTNKKQTIALSIIALVESKASELTAQANNLHGTIEIAIGSYDGLSLSKREESFPISRVKRTLVV